MTKAIHVAVAVIEDEKGKILIARRPQEKHMGGYWEFPGGKVEEGEPVEEALKREILEETGLLVEAPTPLIQIPWHYENCFVYLDVFRCKCSGEAFGLEGQEIKWVAVDDLRSYQFPPANKGIVSAVRLPERIVITDAANSFEDFFSRLDKALAHGDIGVQIRNLEFAKDDLTAFFGQVRQRFFGPKKQISYFLNSSPELAQEHGFRNVHLKSAFLKEDGILQRIENFELVSTSIHDLNELEVANKLGIDFVFISPVKPTTSHPESTALGWDNVQSLISLATMPVYALGGLEEVDLIEAKKRGAQGIAAISAFWN